MDEENIYQTPKSSLSEVDKPSLNDFVLREKNVIACIILLCSFSYALAFLMSTKSGKSLSVMSPFFLGGLFPITAIISAFIIRVMGNTNKVRSDYVISFRVCWSLGWRVTLSAILSMVVVAGLSLFLNFKADQSPVSFFFVYWIVVLPLSTWLLFAVNKKSHIQSVFKVIRGY